MTHIRRLVVGALVFSVLVLPTALAQGLFQGLGNQASAAVVGVKNVASSEGIAEITRTFSAATADYNGDGRDDIFIVRHDPQAAPNIPKPRLWTSEGGIFVDRGGQFTPRDRHVCDWGDANLDGQPDLFCAVGLTRSSFNELRLQKPDHTYADVSTAWGVADSAFHGRGRNGTFVRANDDEWPDLYMTRFYGCHFTDGSCEDPTYPNRLYLNVTNSTGGRKYVKAPDSWGLNEVVGAPHDNAACAQAVDYDIDGDQDILNCGQTTTVLYRHDNGTFVRAGLGTRYRDAQIAQLDNVGRPELVGIKKGQLVVKRGTTTGFGPSYFTLAMSQGLNVGIGDFNHDGFKDIWAVGTCLKDNGRSDQPDYLLLNNAGADFTVRKISPLTRGCGDDVQNLDYNNDGAGDFLVLNGRMRSAGPVQLFTRDLTP